MKFGVEWLREWIDLPVSNQSLYDKMTKSGLEVENILVKPKIFFKNIIIGKIISKDIADKDLKYTIYRIQIQDNKIINILDKNKNFITGTKKLIALIGAKLSSGLIIKKFYSNKIISRGVFCSFQNSDFCFKSDNIITSFCGIKTGTNFFDYLYNNIIKITFPVNRIDLNSITGIVRDISIIYHVSLPKILKNPVSCVSKKFKHHIKINTSEIPIQYIAREIYSIDLKSVLPFKIDERLRKFGCALSSNVLINIINYIFIETGHWIHVLDSDRICGDISVESSLPVKNENKHHDSKIKMFSNSIFLVDEKKILSYGNMEYIKNASITLNTKNIFLGSICLNSLYFNHHFQTTKFQEKKINSRKYNYLPEEQLSIMEYCTNLIIKTCKGFPTQIQRKKSLFKRFIISPIVLNLDRLNKITGYFFTKKTVIKFLKKCKFNYIYKKNNNFLVTPPFWRKDINIEEDIIGEIVRIYDCDNIVSSPDSSIYSTVLFPHYNYQENILSRIKLFLIDQGYYETISYSFIHPVLQKLFFPQKKFFKIINPLSIDMSVMRLSLWIGLIRCVAYNQNRQNQSIRIFETGLCFLSNKEKKLGIDQECHISGAISGYTNNHVWNDRHRKFDFYDLKGIIESILKIYGSIELVEFTSNIFHGLCVEHSTGIYISQQLIGRMGVLDHALHNSFNLKDSVILFEIFHSKIYLRKKTIIQPISDFPVSKRDISIIISDYIKSAEIIEACKNNVSLKNVEIYIYDVYYTFNIPVGKKSISIRFIFQTKKNMLIEDEINTAMQKCILALKTQFQAILRD